MEERVGFRRGLSAAVVLGLYAGFMLAVGASVIFDEDALLNAGILWALTIVISSIVLTPILAMGRKRGRNDVDEDVSALRSALEPCNQGIGGWRALSHVRGEGFGVCVSLTDMKNPLPIIENALTKADEIRIIFRFAKGDLDLRTKVLKHLEANYPSSRLQKRTRTISVMPENSIDKAVIVTRTMMIAPPLMVGGAVAFSSITPGNISLIIAGGVAGLMLSLLITTNKGR
ncbi:MAG: hypothetical protein QGI21_00385 [Candidatus Poseidoniaceae archaeon]|nr:hypothetical protein [Candidatus Poseidoniaceae archaeon]